MATIWRDICQNCDLGIGTLTTLATGSLPGQRKRLRAMLGERVLRVTVKPFMDMNTMIEERLTQCCVHVATRVNGETGDHQCAPFCAVQAWAPLSASRISTATGLPLSRPPRERPADGRARPASRRSAGRRRTTRSGCASSPPSPCSAGCSDRWRCCSSPVLGIAGYAKARRAGLLRSRVPARRHPQRPRVPRPAGRAGGRGPGVGGLGRFALGGVVRGESRNGRRGGRAHLVWTGPRPPGGPMIDDPTARRADARRRPGIPPGRRPRHRPASTRVTDRRTTGHQGRTRTAATRRATTSRSTRAGCPRPSRWCSGS